VSSQERAGIQLPLAPWLAVLVQFPTCPQGGGPKTLVRPEASAGSLGSEAGGAGAPSSGTPAH
jgi:hypothetical protein